MLLVPALLFAAADASAQCANRVSSCVQCHETEGKRRVRDDGADWHRDHALGDFCAGCHGGNAEAASEAEAHQGLASPLADADRSCTPCHATGVRERASRYASAVEARRALPRAPAEPPRAPGAASNNDGVLSAIVAALGIAAGAIVAVTERRRDRLAGGRR